nr:DUF6134 family protein [Rhodothalassium salexigens]
MVTCLALALASAGAAWANLGPQPGFGFDVLRKGETIGRHEIAFKALPDGGLAVDVSIRLKVKFAFITVYRYEHDNREVWRNGRLVALNSATNNNGTDLSVEAQWVDGGYRIVTGAGETVDVSAPDGLLATSYWHPATPDQDRLINTQTGAVMDVTITGRGPDAVAAPADQAKQRIEATRYHLSGPDLAFDLWYDADRCLAKIAFQVKRDGSTIVYRPTRRPVAPVQDDLAQHPLIGHCIDPKEQETHAS